MNYSHKPSQPINIGADLLTIEDDLKVCLNIMRVGKSFLVTGRLQAQVKVACARCLEDFICPLDLPFEDEWVLAEDLAEYRKDVLANSNMTERIDDVFCLEKEEFDITEHIMEHFTLNLPMRFICSDTCRGLCPQCGSNLNNSPCTCQQQAVDSRLALLAQWKI